MYKTNNNKNVNKSINNSNKEMVKMKKVLAIALTATIMTAAVPASFSEANALFNSTKAKNEARNVVKLNYKEYTGETQKDTVLKQVDKSKHIKNMSNKERDAFIKNNEALIKERQNYLATNIKAHNKYNLETAEMRAKKKLTITNFKDLKTLREKMQYDSNDILASVKFKYTDNMQYLDVYSQDQKISFGDTIARKAKEDNLKIEAAGDVILAKTNNLKMSQIIANINKVEAYAIIAKNCKVIDMNGQEIKGAKHIQRVNTEFFYEDLKITNLKNDSEIEVIFYYRDLQPVPVISVLPLNK